MPSSLSCPGLHLLLPSGADAQAPVTSCLLPKSLQLGIPEGTRSGVHASKKSHHRSVPHREARGKSKGMFSSCANSMGNETFPQTLKWKISGETGYIPSLFVQAFFWLCDGLCVTLIPRPGIKLCLLHWRHRVLITGHPRKSPGFYF